MRRRPPRSTPIDTLCPYTTLFLSAGPGTPGLEHRVGGIEKASDSCNISYDPANHQKMTDLRRDKVLGVAQDVPLQAFEAGGEGDRLAVVGWGSTYGPISRAVDNLRSQGHAVRSEERRVGEGWVSTCRSRWWSEQ